MYIYINPNRLNLTDAECNSRSATEAMDMLLCDG